jgi:predicted small lipoprotein YifL
VPRVTRTSIVSRRALLSTGAAAVVTVSLAGCGAKAPTGSAAASDDVAIVESALEDESAFTRMCETLRTQHRDLAPRLDVVITAQLAHEEALADTLSEPVSSGGSSGVIPTTRRQAIRMVSRQAAKLHERRMADCLAAQPGPLAQLFASIAASHAVTAQDWRSA